MEFAIETPANAKFESKTNMMLKNMQKFDKNWRLNEKLTKNLKSTKMNSSRSKIIEASKLCCNDENIINKKSKNFVVYFTIYGCQ